MIAQEFGSRQPAGNPLPGEALGRRAASGEYLWRAGDPEAAPLRVHSGALLYCAPPLAAGLPESPAGLVLPGEVAAPSLGGDGEAFSLLALTPAQVQPADATLLDLVRMQERLIDAYQSFHQLTLAPRAARLLLTLHDAGVEIHCKQELLALALGSRRETLALFLSGWTEQEIISTRYRRVLIRDAEALRAQTGGVK